MKRYDAPDVWQIRDWITGRSKRMTLADVMLVRRAPAKLGPSVAGMLWHAEVSYMACRILFLASEEVHPAALYMAAQTIEKYLKAVLVSRGEQTRGHGHDLVALVEAAGGDFIDTNFRGVCESLNDFEVAGRYADGHDLAAWHYGLDLLSLLDVFAVRCRALIAPLPQGYVNHIAKLLAQDSTENEVMRAAELAVKDNNHMLGYLVAP